MQAKTTYSVYARAVTCTGPPGAMWTVGWRQFLQLRRQGPLLLAYRAHFGAKVFEAGNMAAEAIRSTCTPPSPFTRSAPSVLPGRAVKPRDDRTAADVSPSLAGARPEGRGEMWHNDVGILLPCDIRATRIANWWRLSSSRRLPTQIAAEITHAELPTVAPGKCTRPKARGLHQRSA